MLKFIWILYELLLKLLKNMPGKLVVMLLVVMLVLNLEKIGILEIL